MRFRSFAVLIVVTGLIGIMLAFYFACENFFLESVGVLPEQIGAVMTIGQIAEIVVMIFVPLAVRTLGVKNTMLLGAAAWALRFGLSAYGQPKWLMISTIALHGFAFGFFFVVAQMYVDRAASPDIKATAQNFLIFIVYGMGTIVGSVLTGQAREAAPHRRRRRRSTRPGHGRELAPDLARADDPHGDLHDRSSRPCSARRRSASRWWRGRWCGA